MKSNVKRWGPITWAPAEAGEHMIIAEYGQDVSFYTNSPNPAEHTDPKSPIWIFPSTASCAELTWNEFVPPKELSEKIKRIDDNGNEVNKYSQIVDFHKTDLSIGRRTEFVVLRQIESHPDYAEFISKDGVSMIAIFTIVVKINDAIKAKAAGRNFLNTAHSIVTDTVCKEFSQEKWKDVLVARSGNKKHILDQKGGDSTGDEISDKLIVELKNNPFLKKVDLEIIDVILEKITVTKASADVLDEFENIEIQTNIAAAEIEITRQKGEKKKQGILENDVSLDKMTREFDAIGKFLDSHTDSLVKINKSRNEGLPDGLQTYVNSNNGGTDENNDLISKVIPTFTALQMNTKNPPKQKSQKNNPVQKSQDKPEKEGGDE